jgi:hypothetical protein
MTNRCDRGITESLFLVIPGVALEPKKSPILIFCRQFSNIEAKQNASKHLDNSTNMCDIKLDEGFIVYYYNN